MPPSQQPDPNRALLDLIVQLREAKSPLARVRVVARAWRAVRALTPKQRYEVAVQLGLDGADDLIEAIAAHQGATPPAELMKAVNEVQKMDPATLKSIATRVRNPQQRGEAVRQGLKAVETALAGPEIPPPPPPVSPPAPPVVSKPAASWPLREAPPAVPTPAPPPPAAPVVAAPAPPPPPAPQWDPPRPAEPEPPRAPGLSGPSARPELAEHLGSIPALTARFRHLRKHFDQVRRLQADDLRSLVEVFPDGWARRRVLAELIESGVPARVTDVLALVDLLASPGDRSWCLGAVADTRALSSEERATLLQASPTPAGRRRLELRLGDA
ncbi:MAG: hypothetical protein ABUT39_13285 [Acidobacteriota bacterium]